MSGKLSRRQRMNPVNQRFKDFIGRDPQGGTLAAALIRAGINTPEQIHRLTYAEIDAFPDLGKKLRKRLAATRTRLSLTGTKEIEPCR